MAWEWRTTVDVVETWDFGTFLDKLQWVAELRYGTAVRRVRRSDDEKAAKSREALR